tara:strand:+ start:1531 stop:2229 length:699 start_codon:yes stop_codon:yes gene_type:complete
MYNTDYLRMSNKKFKEQQREFLMKEGLQVFIKDKLTNDISLKSVLDTVSSYIPSHLFSEIDSIYVGLFDDFEKKETNAAYKDGAIYISNEQDDEQDLIDDMVHEVAHSLEAPYGYLIYGDGKLKEEFLSKRKKLYDVLESEGLNPNLDLFMNTEYNLEMDNYLYKEVGYDRLNFIMNSYGIFTSAYPSTSLREYFASGFEYYFLEEPTYLAEICPTLFEKIEELHHYDESTS